MTDNLEKKQQKLADSGTLNPNPDTVSDELFQTSEFFDRDDLLQVKYEMLRRVEKESLPVTTAAKNFGFSRRHFYEIKRQFGGLGLLGLVPEKRGPKEAHKLDAVIVTRLLLWTATDPSLKAPALVELVNKEFGISVHPRSIERALERKKKENLK